MMIILLQQSSQPYGWYQWYIPYRPAREDGRIFGDSTIRYKPEQIKFDG